MVLIKYSSKYVKIYFNMKIIFFFLSFFRISVWVRRNTKTKRLVNNRLWRAIQEKFPDKIEARLKGVDDLDEEGKFLSLPPTPIFLSLFLSLSLFPYE